MPVWLSEALAHDTWLVDLALAVLEWAGTDATAGAAQWPLGSWAQRRAAHTGDHRVDEAVVAREVDVVLAAMRRRPQWYDRSVERPLGRKQAPVWIPSPARAEPVPLVVAPHDRDDAVLSQLASVAVEALALRLGRGEDPALVVGSVLRTVFGSVPAGYDSDRAPGRGETGPERVLALLDDPQQRERIVAAVLELLPRARR